MSALERLRGCVDRRDADGRPLGEQASQHDLGDDVVACPYPGGRAGRPMNRAALRQVTPHLPVIEERLAGASAKAGATVAGAWAATAWATLPPCLAPEPVPVAEAAAYKACLGFRQVLGALLLSHDLRGVPLAELGDAGDFLGLLSREGWLVGRHQVCAGSPAQIRRLYDALATPRKRPATDPRPAAEATTLVVSWLLAERHRRPLRDTPLARLAQHRPGLQPADALSLLDAPSAALRSTLAEGPPRAQVEAWLQRLLPRGGPWSCTDCS